MVHHGQAAEDEGAEHGRLVGLALNPPQKYKSEVKKLSGTSVCVSVLAGLVAELAGGSSAILASLHLMCCVWM